MTAPFTTVRSVAAPLLRDNVDTDLIIRVERLFGAVPREELGAYAFELIRFRPDRTPDPAFPPNDPRFHGAQVLLAGENFGCGSAREGAVWAVRGMGFRAILAPSFGDIFVTNCLQNGVLPVVLPRERIAEIAAVPDGIVVVDLAAQSVMGPDGTVDAFTIPALRRRALLEGLDDIALTLTYAHDIERFQASDTTARPWVYARASASR